MIQFKECDLLKSNADIIAHQVNCMGVMGSGIARQIKNSFPNVFATYKRFCDAHIDCPEKILGTALICVEQYGVIGFQKQCVANLFAQCRYGRDGKQYTDYDALEKALIGLESYARSMNLTVAIPYKMGCALGGGDWDNVVYPMIERIFSDTDILICKYNPLERKR